jgi:hypothetical protein
MSLTFPETGKNRGRGSYFLVSIQERSKEKSRFTFYFLCLDTKKVGKEKSRLKIFLEDGSFGCLRALQLSPDNGS